MERFLRWKPDARDWMTGKECTKIIEKERVRVLSHIREQLKQLCSEEREKNKPSGIQ